MRVLNKNYKTIWPDDNCNTVHIIDQTYLPHRFLTSEITSLAMMISAIKTMQVRGAPLIGAAAAYGIALATVAADSLITKPNLAQKTSLTQDESDAQLQQAGADLVASRPTAVNLQWAVNRMLAKLLPLPVIKRNAAAWQEAATICEHDLALNQALAQHGLALIKALAANNSHNKMINILTHCNAGWLATVDYGTALAPIYAAHDAGLNVHVWVDETRPRNQGASLTAWELLQHGVPHTVIADNAGGHLMQHGQVDMIIVGADRVTSTGDVCNKIGTYLKALSAADNKVPFYVAVPSSTIDWDISDGLKDIEIEYRTSDEIAWVQGLLANGELASVNILPQGSNATNPAFDVTPARLVTGIITERGVCAPHQLKSMFF